MAARRCSGLRQLSNSAATAEAVLVARIGYTMERPEGLRRDLLHCYDLMLPEDFVPHPADGEVAGFELWPLERALDSVAETDSFKFNVNVVLIDLFLRTGIVDPRSTERMPRATGGPAAASRRAALPCGLSRARS